MELKMPTISNQLTKLGLTKNGATQLFATTEAKRLMNPYVPVQNFALRSNAVVVDGGTAIEYQTPYAHYQYKGILYVDPITLKGSFFTKEYGHWSRPLVNKIPSERKLNYTNPNASSEWDKKMMEIHGADFLKSVQAFLDKETK